MNKTKKQDTDNIEKMYEKLKSKTYTLGDLAFGTIQSRWNVCGKQNCKCKRGEKHGPYPYLAFSSNEKGKMISVFIPEDDVPDIENRLKNFQNLREDLEKLILMELKIRQKKRK